MASFREQVDSLVGKRVRLGRGGPDERKGTLVSVQDEFISVFAEDGSMVHYPLHHLKSVTELMGGDEGGGDGSGSGAAWDATGSGSAGFPATFRGLMDSFLGQKVQVYDHGPESAAGFVFEVGDDFVKLVTGPDEMVHYPFFHIRSVRLAKPKNENKNNGKSGNKGGGDGKSGSGKRGSSGSGKSGRGNRGGSSGGKSGRGGRGGSSGGKSGRGGRGRSGGGKSGGGRSGGGRSGGGKSGGGKSGGGRGGRGRRGGSGGGKS